MPYYNVTLTNWYHSFLQSLKMRFSFKTGANFMIFKVFWLFSVNFVQFWIFQPFFFQNSNYMATYLFLNSYTQRLFLPWSNFVLWNCTYANSILVVFFPVFLSCSCSLVLKTSNGFFVQYKNFFSFQYEFDFLSLRFWNKSKFFDIFSLYNFLTILQNFSVFRMGAFCVIFFCICSVYSSISLMALCLHYVCMLKIEIDSFSFFF